MNITRSTLVALVFTSVFGLSAVGCSADAGAPPSTDDDPSASASGKDEASSPAGGEGRPSSWDTRYDDDGGSFLASAETTAAIAVSRWSFQLAEDGRLRANGLDAQGAVLGTLEMVSSILDGVQTIQVTFTDAAGASSSGVVVRNADELVENTLPESGALAWLTAVKKDIDAYVASNPTPYGAWGCFLSAVGVIGSIASFATCVTIVGCGAAFVFLAASGASVVDSCPTRAKNWNY